MAQKISGTEMISVERVEVPHYSYWNGSEPGDSPDTYTTYTAVTVNNNAGEAVHEVGILEQGRYFRYPFYERRLKRALSRASRIAESLAALS